MSRSTKQKKPHLAAYDHFIRLHNGPREYRELFGGLSYGDSLLVFSASDFHLADLAYKDIKRRLRYERAVRRFNIIICKLSLSPEFRNSERVEFFTEGYVDGHVSRRWTSPAMRELYDAIYQCVKDSPYIAASMRHNTPDQRRCVRSLLFDNIIEHFESTGEYTTPSQLEDIAHFYVEHLTEL